MICCFRAVLVMERPTALGVFTLWKCLRWLEGLGAFQLSIRVSLFYSRCRPQNGLSGLYWMFRAGISTVVLANPESTSLNDNVRSSLNHTASKQHVLLCCVWTKKLLSLPNACDSQECFLTEGVIWGPKWVYGFGMIPGYGLRDRYLSGVLACMYELC